MFSITTPELLNKKQVSLYNARGNSSHGNRIKITMKPKRNSQSWEAGAKELGSSPYLRASGSSESEAPYRQDAPPSQPHRLSCEAPRPYRSRNRDGSTRQRRQRAGLSRIQSQRGITRRPRPESFLPAGGEPGRSPHALAAAVRQGRGQSWRDGVSGGVRRGEVLMQAWSGLQRRWSGRAGSGGGTGAGVVGPSSIRRLGPRLSLDGGE